MNTELYNYKARIVSVHDADSVRADISLGFSNWLLNEPIRLYGIDAPEIRGDERPEGLIAKEQLKELIDGKECVITSYKDKEGKYGRYLATIHIYIPEDDSWLNVNQWLIDQGLAVPYTP